jgi:hypothetical protein
MANEKKNPDLNNNKNIPTSKPDSNINRSSPGGSPSKGSGDFGSSSRNSSTDMNKDRGTDMNKNKDMNKDTSKPGRGGFETSPRDPNLDRSQGSSRNIDNEVSGGSSGSSRNH